MTLVMKLNDFSLADSTGFTKLLDDTSLDVSLLSFFDFADPVVIGESDALANDSILPNLVLGASDLGVTSAYSGIQAAKGLPHGAGFESAEIGSEFNLLNLSEGDSFVIQSWVTDSGVLPANSSPVAGHAYQSNVNAQWILWSLNSQVGRYRMQVGSVSVDTDLTAGIPVLFTMLGMYSDGGYTVSLYKDRERLIENEMDGGFANPENGLAAAVPKIGTLGGFGYDWTGTIHSIKIGTVLDTFDAEEYISQEIAAIGDRYYQV